MYHLVFVQLFQPTTETEPKIAHFFSFIAWWRSVVPCSPQTCLPRHHWLHSAHTPHLTSSRPHWMKDTLTWALSLTPFNVCCVVWAAMWKVSVSYLCSNLNLVTKDEERSWQGRCLLLVICIVRSHCWGETHLHPSPASLLSRLCVSPRVRLTPPATTDFPCFLSSLPVTQIGSPSLLSSVSSLGPSVGCVVGCDIV